MSVNPAALLDAARAARANAYAPYSKFHVGAAIATKDDIIIVGANVENASYGLSLCAEAVVIAEAHAGGLMRDAVAIAVVGDSIETPSGAIVTPCGRCRQMLVEAEHVAGRAIAIYTAPVDGAGADGMVEHRVADLLPHAFGPASL